MRLSGTEEWDNEAVSAVISYELAFAEGEPSLRALVRAADLGKEVSPREFYVPEAIFAQCHAAELAFAVGDVERGITICLSMRRRSVGTPAQAALYATIGALVRTMKVSLHPWGASIDTTGGEQSFDIRWNLEDSSEAVSLIRQFVPAAAASGLLVETVETLFGELSTTKPQIRTALLRSDEYRALFGLHERNEQAIFYERMNAIEAMEEGYARRVALMQSDSHHWDAMQPKGSLIDWPLLCTWVAYYRSRPTRYRLHDMRRSSDVATFVRWLAREIWQYTDRHDRH